MMMEPYSMALLAVLVGIFIGVMGFTVVVVLTDLWKYLALRRTHQHRREEHGSPDISTVGASSSTILRAFAQSEPSKRRD